jgi:NAD(P)-dependent dehydrogenase (short-subunit alcohol dehydrogenase family)
VVAKAAADAGVALDTTLLDVTDADRCRQVVDDVRPFAVVNNAGYSITGAVEDVDDGEARDALETMVVAPMRLARLAIRHMRDRGEGRIVNISSIYGRATTPVTGWYQAAKHALEAVSDALRIEVAGDGIKVVLVEPGGFRTGIWDAHEEEMERRSGSRYGRAYQRTLLGTRLSQPFMGEPETVAKVIGRALESRWPRPRYVVGYDAQLIALWDSFTPTELKDRLTRLALGL